MNGQIINSNHAGISTGTIGRILKPEEGANGVAGYEMVFEKVSIHQDFLQNKGKAVIAWFPESCVKILTDAEVAIAEAPTPEVIRLEVVREPEKVKPCRMETVCCAVNPLLSLVLCQLPKAHKGNHRAEVDLIGKQQIMIWE